MAFMKKENACDNCGKNLDDVDNPVEEGENEFCGEKCQEKYEEEHGHDDAEEEEVCRFC